MPVKHQDDSLYSQVWIKTQVITHLLATLLTLCLQIQETSVLGMHVTCFIYVKEPFLESTREANDLHAVIVGSSSCASQIALKNYRIRHTDQLTSWNLQA